MNTMKKLVINGLWLAFGWLVAVGLCGTAWAAAQTPISYQTWDPGLKLMVPGICQNYTVVKDTMTELNSGWYVVTSQVVIDRSGGELPGLKVNGDAHLILVDGAELVVTGATKCAGIEVGVVDSVTNSLTIYGQQGQTGKLTATGVAGGAGIGGNFHQSCGIVTINGGIVTTTLIPNESSGTSYSAGIGGGVEGCGGVITINAGKVMATGCACAIGIGTGGNEKNGPYGAGCVITINGGEVTAIGGAKACGIGGAQHTGAGKVTINGGTVLANGGFQGAGIGAGVKGEAWDVTITGGKVRAVSCGDFKGMLFGGAGAGIGGVAGCNGVTVTITGGEVEAISYPIEQGEEFYLGEGIGAGVSVDPTTPLSSGTLDLSGYEGVKILAGMDTNGVEVTEVQAGDFLDKGGVIGWHTNLYVHIMAGSTRPLGSPENPWNVGGTGAENAVQAYTNGNGMLVLEGGGLVVEKPWLGDGIKDGITEIMIKDRGVELSADAFIGMGADAEAMIVLKLPDGWQGNLPDATGVWQGAKVTIVTWPRMIRNVSFQQRYPWSGTVDITADVYGPESSGVQLVVSALNGRAPLTVSDENLDGDTVVDLTNGPKQVSFIWDATGEVGMENFRSTSVFVKVAFAEAGDPVETTIWKGYKEMVNWDQAYQHYLGEDGGGSDIPVGAEMRLYVQVLNEEGEEIDVQIHEGHWKKTFVDVDDPDTEIVDGHVSFTVTDEIAQFFRTPVGWGGLVVVQGKNAAVTKFSYFAPDRPVTYSAAGRLDLRKPIIVAAGGNDQITYSQTQWGRNLAGTAVNIRFGAYRAESLPICPGLEGLTGTGVAPFTYPTATGRYEFEHEILTVQQANAKAMAHPEVLVVWYVGADDPQSVYAYADGTGKVIVEGAGTPKALGAGDEPWAGAEPPITKIIVPTGRGPEFREKWPALAGMITGSPAPESDFEFDPDTGTITGYTGAGGDVVIPSTIGGVDVKAIGRGVFSSKALTAVTIPASVTTVEELAFLNCSSLTSVTFEAGSQLKGIGPQAFYGCPLTGITLPEGLTDIGQSAFAQCTNLTTLTIPAGVTNIGMLAFSMCSKLEEVTVLAIEPPPAGMRMFSAAATADDPIATLKAIKVPAGSVEGYKGADGWKEYADLITAGSAPAEPISKLDFSLRLEDDGKGGGDGMDDATVTISGGAPLAEGEIWAWASFSIKSVDEYTDARTHADEVWSNLNAKVGSPVGSVNLMDVTNGLEAASFGTFTSSPHDFLMPTEDGRIVFVRAKTDGTILAVGGVKSFWKNEGGVIVCENEMFGTGKIPVAYYAWDESAKDVVLKEPVEAIQLTDEITALEDGQWYVAIGQCDVEKEITVSGSAHLVLWKSSPAAHGAEVSFKGKVTIGASSALSIYGMSKVVYGEDANAGKVIFWLRNSMAPGALNPTVAETGTLNIHGAKICVENEYGNRLQCGTLNVYGGILEAYGPGEESVIRVDSALNVYGGWVFAHVNDGGTGAAIGGAAGQDGCTVNVYGGWVEAFGGEGAAGIGAGAGGTSHGSLTVGEGMSVWVAEDEESTKSLAPSYAETRERYVWITTCSEKVEFQKFTATMGETTITLKMPSVPGDGYCYGVLKMPQTCARLDVGVLVESPSSMELATLLLSQYSSQVENGSLLVGEMSFTSLTSMFDMLAMILPAAGDYEMEFFDGDTVELDRDGLDAMFVCRVENNENHGIATIGGCTHLADLEVTESKGDEMDPAPAPAAMIVTDNGATTNLYYSIQEAFDSDFTADQSVTNTVTLLRDYTETRDVVLHGKKAERTTVLGDATTPRTARLDLNGRVLAGGRSEKVSGEYHIGPSIYVAEGSVLIIDDSSANQTGEIRKTEPDPAAESFSSGTSAESMFLSSTISIHGGDVTLERGTIRSAIFGSYSFCVMGIKGRFTMSGGEIVGGADAMAAFGIMAYGGGHSATITGGKIAQMVAADASAGCTMSISGGLFGTRGEEGMYIDDWLADGVTLSPNTDPVTLAEGYLWKVAIPVPGSPENPWDVGRAENGQPQAVTNGNNEVIVTGEGLPKSYGDENPAPWAGFEPPIETIYVPQGTEDIYRSQWTNEADKIVVVPDYLSFTAKDGDVNISFGKNYSETYGLEYSFDPLADEWAVLPEFDLDGSPSDSDKVLIPNGQTLYIRKAGEDVTLGVGTYGKRATFQMERVENDTATIEAGGNVMSLLDKTCRSKEVGDYAFYYLFANCSILTTAPKLPATKLGISCYQYMFSCCSALKAAPKLPAMELADYCYYDMFHHCGSLEAIELPAKNLAPSCYGYMCDYCHKLNAVKVGFDAWPSDGSCDAWLREVAPEGTFVCSAALENDFGTKGLEHDMNTIPEGWRTARDYLSFTAKDGDITLSLEKFANPFDATFEYSFSAGAENWTTYSEHIQITKDQTVYFRKQGAAVEAISRDGGNFWRFVFDGDEGATVAAGGNVMSLLDPTCQSRTIGKSGLVYLFDFMDRLTSAPSIEADHLGENACEGMFRGCANLASGIEIVAEENLDSGAIRSLLGSAAKVDEITVAFKEWAGANFSIAWVDNVAPFGVFHCPSELPIVVDRDHIPVGWIVFKKFSIPAIEGVKHSAINIATGEELAPVAVSQDGTKTYEVLAGGEDEYIVRFLDVEDYKLVVDGDKLRPDAVLELKNLEESVEIGQGQYTLPERGVLLQALPADFCSIKIDCGGDGYMGDIESKLLGRVSSNVPTRVVYVAVDGLAFAIKGGYPVTESVPFEDLVTEEGTVVDLPEPPSIRLDQFEYVRQQLEETAQKVRDFPKSDEKVAGRYMELHESKDPEVANLFKEVDMKKKALEDVLNKNKDALYNITTPEDLARVQDEVEMVGQQLKDLGDQILKFEIPTYTLTVANDGKMTTYSAYAGEPLDVLVENAFEGNSFGSYIFETPVKVVYTLRDIVADQYAFDNAKSKSEKSYVAYDGIIAGDRTVTCCNLGFLPDLDGAYKAAIGQLESWEKELSQFKSVGPNANKFCEKIKKDVQGLYDCGVPVDGTIKKIGDLINDAEKGQISEFRRTGYQEFAQNDFGVLKQEVFAFAEKNSEKLKQISEMGTAEAAKLYEECDRLTIDLEDFSTAAKGVVDAGTYANLQKKRKEIEDKIEDLQKRIDAMTSLVTMMPIRAVRDIYDGRIYVDINQSRRGNEVRWVYLWFNNRDAGRVAFDKLSAAIGMKPSEVPVSILDTFDCYDRGESDYQSMPPQGTSIRGITAFVIVAVDSENCITRIGGVDNLDTIIQGDIKGADIVGNDPVSISYYKFNSEGDDNQKSVRAQPIRGGKPITLDGSKEPAFWVAFGDCTVEQINVVGEVTIILANGCRLSAETGINVADGATLYICSEKHPQYEIDSMGRLVVESNGKLPAAIYLEGGKSNLEIHGGKIAVNSTMAGIRGNLQVYQGVTTVTAGEGYAGVDIGNVQGCVYHGKLTVTGGAGAAAIGTSVGNETGFAFLVNGGLVRGDATPDATGACGAGVGAWAGWKEQGKLDHSGMFVFAAPSATNAMKRVDADYEKSRDPSVLFTTATEFVKPLPFDVERYGEAGYNLDFGTKLEEGRYTYLVLSKNDVVRKFGTNSTIGQEVWKTVEQVAMGDRIVVGELNWNDFVLSLVKMGVKECTGRVLTSGESYDDFWPGFAPEMVIACATDENGQIIRLGGARSLAEMAMNDAPVESQIGAEMIEPFAFKVVNSAKDDALVIDGFADPNDTEHMFFYGFTKEDISNYFGTPEKIMGEISYYIGKRVGTLSQDIFNGKSKYTVSYGNDKLTFPRDGSVVVVVGVVGTPYKQIKRVGMVTGVEQLVKAGDEKSPEAVLIGKQDFSVVNHWDTLYISMPDGCDDGGDWVWIRVCDENQYEALDSYINGLIGTPVGEATLCPLDPNAIPAIFGDGNWGLFRGGDTEINAYGYNKGERARGVIVFKTYPAEGGLDGAMMIRSVGGVRKVDKLQDGPALSNQYGEGLEYIVNQPLTVTRQSDMTFLVEPTGSLGTDESWMYATFTSDNDYNVSDLTEFLSAYQGAVVGDLGADFVRDIKLYNYDVECNTTSEGSFTVSEDTTAVILFKVKEDKVVATIGLAEDLDRLFDPGMSKGDTFCKTFITAQDFGVTRAGDALTASISSSDMYEVGQNDRIICFTFKEAPKGEAFYKAFLPTILNGQTEVGAWTMSNVGEENVDVIGTFTEDNLQIELPAGCKNVFVARVHGADDVIVTLGGVLTSDVADGETQQPDVGIERIRPFNFEVTHEEDGTFSLVSDVRKVHEGWVWLAFPSHVFYTLEPQYESAEAFLDMLRQEMVAYGATGSLGGKYVSNLSTLFTMLGDGYCGTSLDEALNVKNIPADTEIVVVYKLDRGTDKPLGEGIVIGLQDLGAGEKKQNQVDGRQVYATVDLDGTRTLHETAEPVETITELTPSIGGGRWYVVYDVRKLRESWTASTRRLVVDGEANIILLDNSLTGNSKSEVSASFEGGISVPEGSVLNIYGQRRGIAALSCQGLNGNAAIGGDAEQGCGTINIYGGVVQAVAEDGAAAIGGGYLNGEKNGTVNLYGGVVMARSADAAAIGGGRYGRGCDVTIGTAATAHCRLRSNDPTVEAPGIGGCDGFNNGLVDVYGENRVYIPLDGQGREYKDKAYYLGDVRRNNFFTSDLVTLTLPKDNRFQFSPASMLGSYEAGALLPGDDANTYKIMRGDTVRVMAKIAAKSIGEDYGFRSPSTFMFDCVQGDVALAADELKIAMGRAITTMDFKVRRDANGGLYLSTTEKFDTNEQLVWVVIPSDIDAKLASSPIVVDPVDTFTRQMQGQGIQIGELVVDQYAAQLGAKNWNIVFDYAGEEIELPADALHVVAFKVFDAGKYASSGKVKLLSVAGGPSVEDRLETTEPLVGKEPVKPTRVSGRMPALKLGAINRIDDIASGDEWGNQVAPRVIARQPFTLTREEKGDFRLALHGELGAGEQWGYATINSMVWEAIKAGQAGDITIDSLKELLDSQIGHPIGYFTIEHMDRFRSVFSKFEMSKECVFRLEPDTAAVMAFRVLDDKLFVSLGYVMDELQAMVPGGTDRKANMIDGQVDEPLYFITVENIPEHVKPSAVITWDTMYRTIEPDVVSKDFVIYSAPSGVNLTVTFEAEDGWTIRSRDAASVKPVWRDETIDASFVYVVESGVVICQDFNLYRNEDKTFRFSVPDEKLDLEHGERWLYIAVGETDGAVGFAKSKRDVAAPISSLLWQYASEMIGKQIGKSSTSAEVFQIAMKNGYSGCVTELKEVTLPADTAMLIVCKCYTFTEENGLTRTYILTEGGCQDLQMMAAGEWEERHNELDDAKMSDIEVSYQYWDIGAGRFRTSRVYARYLTDTADVIGHGDWYVVEEGADLGNLKVEGTANLIVRDQTTLEIGSIEVGEGATLNIYGQGGRSGNIQIFNDAEDGVFAVGSADGVCGTINIHGVNARILCNRGIGIGGTAKGGELNVFGANLLASGYEKAIAGCTLNFYAGQLIAGAEDAAAVAITDDISLKSDKLMLLAGDDITALTPTTVTDYTANRQPFAKVVEYVNIIVPTVEYARATVSVVEPIERRALVPVTGEPLSDGWTVYKVERFGHAVVNVAAERGYTLRSPAAFAFYSIDSDKVIPVDVIAAAPAKPTQLIARQPFTVERTTDENGAPCFEVKPIGELGPGEMWLWMSCDATLAQTTGTVEGDKNQTTQEAIVEMLNQAIGRAPVGAASLDMYRYRLPIARCGVGDVDTVIRLANDTDLVLFSKVYDAGLDTKAAKAIRYYNITLGLATNLQTYVEGDAGHNEIGPKPTPDEIQQILEDSFPTPNEVTQNEDGTFLITLQEDMTGPVAIPDNIGTITLDLNGFHITGTNSYNGAVGGSAIVITESGDVGDDTELTITEPNEKYDADGDIVGGNGADGQRPGNGGAAIRVDTKRGVKINVEGTVQVVGGKGGTLLGDEDSPTKPGAPGKGVDPSGTRGDRALGSDQEGEVGGTFAPWAKATLAAEAPDNLQTLLPDGVTVVGNELWFWKRVGTNVKAVGFDFTTLDRAWIKDGEIRFVAGSHFVDQFLYNRAGGLAFVGASSAAVVVKPEPVKPVDPEEKPVKPVLKAGMLGGKDSGLPDLGKHTTLASTGKSIFQSKDAPVVNGPLMGSYSGAPATWRNLAFTMLPGTVIEGNGGAINAADVYALMVADCVFANIIAGELGGAIYAAGLNEGGLITNSTFTACSVSDANGLGGAIYASAGRAPVQPGLFGKKFGSDPGLAVVDCIFALNVAESGGAICTALTYEEEEPIALKVSGTSFVGNFADYNGGAIYAGGKVELLDAEVDRGTFFGSNEAGVYGGALAAGGTEDTFAGTEVFVGSNTVFACNKVENDWFGEAMGGAINLPENCALTVRNALFTNNVAHCSGGAVYGVYGGAVCTATGCTNRFEKTAFVDNRAIATGASGNRYAAGGAVSDLAGVTLVDTCVFDANVVEGESRVGAALDFEFGEETAVVNSTFRRSNVEAVSVYAVAAAVIRNCVIVGNAENEEWYDLYVEETPGYELTFTAYGKLYTPNSSSGASSNNFENCVAAEVYRGETLYLATNAYNKVAALGYPQPGVTDFVGVEYGSTFWGTSMGAFETPAIYPVEELGFDIYVDPLELAWTGTQVQPSTVVVTNPYTHAELTEGVDYTVGFMDNVNSTDKALVIVTGIGNYAGTATTNYWITSYLVKYYACEKSTKGEYERPLDVVELGSLSGSNVVATIAPPPGYALDPYHEGSLTNGTVSLYDSAAGDEANGRLVLKVFYAPSGDDDVPDKYQRKITYKVANGWWNDAEDGLDRTVWVTLFDADGKWSENGIGKLTDIPLAGQKPFSGYAKAGVWYSDPPTGETLISPDSPALPFFLYVYCAQPQGGTGRGGRGSLGSVTQADLDALKSHLVTKLTITDFAYVNGKAAGEARAAVVDELTGQTILDELLRRTKIDVLATPSLDEGEWSVIGSPTTDGEGGWGTDERPPAETPAQMFFKLRLR